MNFLSDPQLAISHTKTKTIEEVRVGIVESIEIVVLGNCFVGEQEAALMYQSQQLPTNFSPFLVNADSTEVGDVNQTVPILNRPGMDQCCGLSLKTTCTQASSKNFE